MKSAREDLSFFFRFRREPAAAALFACPLSLFPLFFFFPEISPFVCQNENKRVSEARIALFLISVTKRKAGR
jgi:hypothetical protein